MAPLKMARWNGSRSLGRRLVGGMALLFCDGTGARRLVVAKVEEVQIPVGRPCTFLHHHRELEAWRRVMSLPLAGQRSLTQLPACWAGFSQGESRCSCSHCPSFFGEGESWSSRQTQLPAYRAAFIRENHCSSSLRPIFSGERESRSLRSDFLSAAGSV